MGATTFPPDNDKGEEDTGGDEEGNVLGDVDVNNDVENPPSTGVIEGILTVDGINRERRLATAATAASFAANMDRW